MWERKYPSGEIKVYTSAELNGFGKRYHDIMVKTGQGIKPENRTKEQINLVNKIVTSMVPVLETIAFGLLDKGYSTPPSFPFAFSLRGITEEVHYTPRIDVIHEGIAKVIENFQKYDPYRFNGSVYTFVLFQAGEMMRRHIIKNIPNGPAITRKIKKNRKIGRSKEEVYENLPYINPVSLTSILYGDKDEMRYVALERDYLTSNENPEEEVISKMTGEHIPKVVEELLSVLNPRERTILECRRGLNGYEKMTLVVLGRKFGISKERVRQIESKAEDKLGKIASRNLVSLLR